MIHKICNNYYNLKCVDFGRTGLGVFSEDDLMDSRQPESFLGALNLCWIINSWNPFLFTCSSLLLWNSRGSSQSWQITFGPYPKLVQSSWCYSVHLSDPLFSHSKGVHLHEVFSNKKFCMYLLFPHLYVQCVPSLM